MKGHGDQFFHWMYHPHPGAHLLPVERASGSRQDLAVEGAGALFMNSPYYVDFLDKRLRNPYASNILQENIFIILSPTEMILYSRICSIIYIAIFLPT